MSVINTNVKALGASASLSKVEKSLSQAMERLSTGQRINSAKDDAAGLAITNRMTAQIRGYAVAIRNANDGLSMAQTAQGALGQVSSMLQRMRELAVQAATGTMSAADRNSLQQEVVQLNSEIDNIATKTNHNNIKLLDGSAGDIQLQTGVFASDSMNIGFDSVQTKDIGIGSKPSLTSNSVSTTALSAGDLLINGVAVGRSVAEDDKLSYGDEVAGSAIAKVAAINKVSNLTGVVATVGQTVAYGASMEATAASGKTITINGITTAAFDLTGTSNEANRKTVALAINDISAQTGVKAINTEADSQGIVLIAEDGRNIVIDLATDGLTQAQTGISLGTAIGAGNNFDSGTGTGTWVGNYSLTNYNGKDITISTNEGNTLSALTHAGLSAGVYSSSKAQVVTAQRDHINDGQEQELAGMLAGNTMTINNVAIDAASANDDSASVVGVDGGAYPNSYRASSAIAIAAAINRKESLTGVHATAEANVIYGTGFSAGAVGSIWLNGITIDTSNGIDSVEAAISAINAHQGATGVVASQYGTGVKLTAADGRNISIAVDGNASAIGLDGVDVGDAAETASTYYASLRLTSDKPFELKSGSEGNDGAGSSFEALGFKRGTFGGSDNGLKVGSVDISSASGATASIYALDAAIETISAMQSRAGAYQNRLEAVVSNLTESNQNMSAARSRILDTDYATETTNLAKSQIIQQAATAMLAQANQSAQTVLALLK